MKDLAMSASEKLIAYGRDMLNLTATRECSLTSG